MCIYLTINDMKGFALYIAFFLFKGIINPEDQIAFYVGNLNIYLFVSLIINISSMFF